MLNQIKDSLKTGALAGLVVGLLAGIAETILASTATDVSRAPLHGYLLEPFFFWALLLPAGVFIGAAFGFWFWCWHGRTTASLREGAIERFRAFQAGSLAPLGWFWAVGITAVCAIAAGAKLLAVFDETFNNRLLAGVVLRRSFISLGHAMSALRSKRLGRLLRSTHLAILSLAVALSGLVAALAATWDTLEDIGIDTLVWLAALPAAFVVAFAVVVAGAPRWQNWRRLKIWMILTLLLGPVAATGLGELQAVRQAASLQDTPAGVVVSMYLAASDFDGDGASPFFGGGDCAPFNRLIGPGVAEIPGNGIDDNCMAGDAPVNTQKLRNASAYAPLPAGFPSRPNLVLITVDALRADHMSLYGYGRATTPRLDRHAKSGVVFERAYSQGSGTISSMPSLLTSKYYTDDRMPPAISPRETMLAEHLKKAGYTTMSVTSLGYANSGRWGLLQGFDVFDQTVSEPQPNHNVTSPRILAIAEDLLHKGKKGRAPFFLWVHFYDPHGRYLEHEGQRSFGTSALDKYDGEVLFTDAHVGRLLDVLRAPNAPPTVIIFGSDHGDGFKEDRGRRNHAYGLYGELLHVPLVVWAPNAEPQRVDTPVGNVDIAATLVNAAGLKKPYLRGNSLFPYMYDGLRDPDRLIFSEKTFGQGAKKRYQKAVTGMHWKMVRWVNERREFLFDLKNDPREMRDVIQLHPDIAAALRKQIDLIVERNAVDTLDLE
jgi:arylsulfatase A-like enzyme